MPRIPTVDSRDALPAEHQVVWDNILASRGRVAGPWLVMLHTPPIADMVAHLGALLRFDLPFDPPVRELAILATVRELKCEFEWAAHVAEGRKVGVREEAIDAVRAGTAPAGLTPDEAQVVNYVHLIVRQHRVDDATFEAMKARFGERGLVELTSLIGYYNMVSTVMDAFGVEPPANTDRMPL